jgi:hypothetical protein
LDGDGLNEILFIGEPENSSTYYLMILESVWDEDSGGFEFSFKPDYESFTGRSAYRLTPICAIADFDGDSITTSDGMLYGGEVSNIPAADWDISLSFSWGLFSYREILGNEKFIVVQYYTGTL